jgi:hypothetical protein
MKVATSILVVSLLSSPVYSQSENLEKILVSVAVKVELPGAFGSIWTTPLAIVNHGSEKLTVHGIYVYCPFGEPCVPPELVPDVTLFPTLEIADTPLPGECYCKFLRVAANRVEDLALSLRIQDVSRQSQTWGTEVPTVRERDARTSETELLDIPVGEAFRTLMRFYDFEPAAGHQLRVRIYQIDPSVVDVFNQPPDVFLEEVVVTLQPPHTGAVLPGYAQLSLSSLSRTPLTGRLRVEIEPITSGLKFWAFASVTNNETQHVTTVVPR